VGTTESQALRIFLFVDDPSIRNGLRVRLGDHVEVVGHADEADTAIELILGCSPEVVLLDIQLPDSGTERVVRAVTEQNPDVGFLVVSGSVLADPADLVPVIAAGALGYLNLSADAALLLGSIEEIATGIPVMSQGLAGVVRLLFVAADLTPSDFAFLKPQESKVLRLSLNGYRYDEIADELSIDTDAVRHLVSLIFDRLRRILSDWILSDWREGGSAPEGLGGVREPRRPGPDEPAGDAAIEEPRDSA
jgi:DNA-binding NarL/FixJ family response regulator